MKVLISFLILTFSLNALALCQDSIDQVSYRVCLGEESNRSEQRVKTKQIELLDKINAWDEEPEFRKETIRLFEFAKKSFEAYKIAQCQYESSAAAGGNGSGSMGAICMIKLNNEYLKSLEKQLSWYDSY